MRLPSDERLAIELMEVIRKGQVVELSRLLKTMPDLARATILEKSKACGAPDFTGRSPLHIATDWPGHFPNVAQTIQLLVVSDSDVNAKFIGKHEETPLHWAASSDDVDALDALLDCGADIEAKGGVIAGGTPLADATAFGKWRAARRLIQRGATPSLWDAAALVLLDHLAGLFAGTTRPDCHAITSAFWGACHGSQLATAEYLLQQGANMNWVGYDHLTPLDAAKRSEGTSVIPWLEQLGARSAKSLR